MYNKFGSKLKVIAAVIRVLGIIAAIVLAVACWGISGGIKYNDTLRDILIGTGFLVGLLVAIPVVIGSLILSGFGELIVLTDDSNECLRKLAGIPAKQNVNMASNTYYNNTNASNTWVCSNCGKSNSAAGDFCVDCGSKRA